MQGAFCHEIPATRALPELSEGASKILTGGLAKGRAAPLVASEGRNDNRYVVNPMILLSSLSNETLITTVSRPRQGRDLHPNQTPHNAYQTQAQKHPKHPLNSHKQPPFQPSNKPKTAETTGNYPCFATWLFNSVRFWGF